LNFSMMIDMVSLMEKIKIIHERNEA